MRSQKRTLLFNAGLLLILLIVTLFTFYYGEKNSSVLRGIAESIAGPVLHTTTFIDKVEAHMRRYQSLLAGDGRRERIKLSFFPATNNSIKLHSLHNQQVMRLRSAIVARSAEEMKKSSDLQSWYVHSVQVGDGWLGALPLLRQQLRTSSTSSPSEAEASPVGTKPNGSLNSAAASEVGSQNVPYPSDPVAAHGEIRKERNLSSGLSDDLPKPNAVLLLMSPTFSNDVELSAVSPAGVTSPLKNGGLVRAPVGNASVAPFPEAVVLPLPTKAKWRCRKCQRFLEEMLPALERNYLSRFPYPVHIFHRGAMPSEVVQYITAILPSATQLIIEDVSGVFAEKVTVPSTVALEPWLQEMSSDLLFRKRFSTAAPTVKLPAFSQTSTTSPTSPKQDCRIGFSGTTSAGVKDRADRKKKTAANEKPEPTLNDALGGANPPPSTVTPPSPEKESFETEKEKTVTALRHRWESHRFWTGLLFLLPSLQSYDYFWYMDAQSRLTKPVAQDVLAVVANRSCAAAYTHLVYRTQKRVPKLLESVLEWNAQSVMSYFSPEQVRRAESWLTDDRPFYNGKTYAPDCFIISLAVTRHPAYIDFFHWIDSRPPHLLMSKLWGPMAVYTVMTELLAEKYQWDTCSLDPLSGYRPMETVPNPFPS